MESLLNYLAYESKNKMVDQLPWQQQITCPKTFINTKVNFNRQNQLLACLCLMPFTSAQVEFIWEDTIQSKSMHTKCKKRLPPHVT